MPTTTQPATARRTVNDLLLRSFLLSLEASNRSPNTRKVYAWAIRGLIAYAAEQNMPADVTALTREHIESYMANVLAHRKPATAGAAYQGLRQFYGWLESEGKVTSSPMARMKPPQVLADLAHGRTDARAWLDSDAFTFWATVSLPSVVPAMVRARLVEVWDEARRAA